MENARIALFEDEAIFRAMTRASLELEAHQVVAEVGNLDEADALLSSVEEGHINFDIAIVDGNLAQGRLDGADGEYISKRLHNIGGIFVIGFTGDDLIQDADVSLKKMGKGHQERLLEEIKKV